MPEKYRTDYLVFDHEVPATRSQAPDFSDLKLSIGPLFTHRHGGHDFLASNVHVFGTMFTKMETGDRDERSQVQVVGSEKIGVAFLKKKGSYSFEPALINQWSKGYVRKLYIRYKGELAEETLCAFAEAVSMAITRRNPGQFSNSMRERIPKWLMEEGTAEKLALSLVDLLKIAEVMNA